MTQLRGSRPRFCLIVWPAIAFESGVLLLALGIGWVADCGPFDRFHFDWKALLWSLVATVPPVLALWGCVSGRSSHMQRLVERVEELLEPLLNGCSALDLAVVSVCAGLCEEALFRGTLQPLVSRYTQPWIGLTVAGLLFGLAHPLTATYAMLAGLFGSYLGWLMAAGQNLLPAIIVHALYDFLALLYLRKRLGSRREAEC